MHHERRSSPWRWLIALPALALLIGTAALPRLLAAEVGKPEKLLFVSSRAGARSFNIFTINPDGSEPANLTKSSAMELDPAWSPDHTRIAFAAVDPAKMRADIYVMKADGSERTRLTDTSSGAYAFAPAWSPDGRQIAYSTIQDPKGVAVTRVALFLIGVDGKSKKSLGEGMTPLWSPDGTKLAFTAFSNTAKGETPSTYVMAPDGTARKRLVEDGVAAAWSPDGKRLLFMGEGGGSPPDLFVIDANGAHRTALTHTAAEMEFGARWSADGKQIFFTRFPTVSQGAPRARIYLMDVDGSHVKPLTDGDSVEFMGVGFGLIAMMSEAAGRGG